MMLFRVEFMPLMGKDSKGDDVQTAVVMCFVTAEHALRIEGVLRYCLPELADDFDVTDVIPVPSDKHAWVATVGPGDKAQCVIVVATDQEEAEKGLVELAAKGDGMLSRYIKMGLWRARLIHMDKESVW